MDLIRNTDEIISFSRKPVELKKFYLENYGIIKEFQPLVKGPASVDLMDKFVDLSIVNAGNYQTDSVCRVEQNKVFKNKIVLTSISYSEIVMRQNSIVLIAGVAGIGKTWLLRRFLLDWSNNLIWKHVDLLFYLECRVLNQHENISNIKELLNVFYKDIVNDFNISNHTVMFIIDGLDEFKYLNELTNPSSNCNYPIGNVLAELSNPSSSCKYPIVNVLADIQQYKCVVAGRVLAIDQYESKYTDYDKYQILGFNDDGINSYIEKNVMEKNKEVVKTSLKESPKSKFITHIPFYLSSMCKIFSKSKKLNTNYFKTISELYTNLFTYFLQKHKKHVEVLKEDQIKLHDNYEVEEELYKSWLRYLDVAVKYRDSGVSELVKQIFFKEFKYVDWRIARKMLDIQTMKVINLKLICEDLVDEGLLKNEILNIRPESLFKPIIEEIKKAFEYLQWKDEKAISTKLAKSSLKILEKYFNTSKLDAKLFKKLSQAIISGRFDKKLNKKCPRLNTIIMGEDGGMYLLLNNHNANTELLIKEIEAFDYIYTPDLISKKNKVTKRVNGIDQIEIGKGSFGKVRLALSLLDSKAKPGDVICVKKSKSFEKLQKEHQKNGEAHTKNPLNLIIDTTIENYFTNGAENIIYAPEVFDISLVLDKTGNVEDEHRKGYVMMELFPQNTAANVFKDEKYRLWEFQKPYLLDLFKKTQRLLNNNIAMTDLKTENTLYNTNTRKATIIDIGGTVKLQNKEEIIKFDTKKYEFQSTDGFRAPELQQAITENKGVIDLNKALAFSAGKIIGVITKDGTDIFPREHCSQVKVLMKRLTNENLNQRISIQVAIIEIKAIGDDNYKKTIVFTHYISKIKERLKNNKSSISINEDIETLTTDQGVRELVSNEDKGNKKSLYIDIDVAELNPHIYAGLNTEDLLDRIDNFWNGKNKNEVMLLLGVAGSGKSITLQLNFIKAVGNWKVGDPIPIYFNLASNIDLVKIIESLNKELGTNIDIDDFKKVSTHLYIDSFDEGLSIATCRETLIISYIKKLKNSKILVSCRTSYLLNDNDYSWFKPESNLFEVYYIAPVFYSGRQNLEGCVNRYINWLSRHTNSYEDAKHYLDKINQLKIKKLIDTVFMFEVVMQLIPFLSLLKKDIFSRQDIYNSYVEVRIEKSKVNQKLNKKQKEKIFKLLESVFDAEKKISSIDQLLKELGKYIAIYLYLQNKFKINNASKLFKVLEYKSSTLFNRQALYFILKLLPLKIITKNAGSKFQIKQEVEVLFAHDLIKNYYLFEAIKYEIQKSNYSEILSSKSIVKDVELVKLIADDLVYNKDLRNYLRQSIDLTKKDKSLKAVTLASNCITLLVAAKHSFSGEALSNISIRGANIRNGIFQYADFSNADLTGVNLTNANLVGARLIGSNMTGIELSIQPDLDHNVLVKCLSYSPDGRYIASGSQDNSVKIWDANNSNIIHSLEKHTHPISCISYSPDGKYLASGSQDFTVKIWDANSGKLINDQKRHTDIVMCISYSPDSKYFASGSKDKTLKIWDANSGHLINNLKEHTDIVICINFSSDSKYLASGSFDNTIKIWEVNIGKLFKDLKEHTDLVTCVMYTPNGRHLASGSNDHTVKIWEASSGNLLKDLKEHTRSIICISYSPDGKYLASGSSDDTVKIWDASGGEMLKDLKKHTYPISCISYSPNGKYLASGSLDFTIKIWDAFSGSLLQTLPVGVGKVSHICYSPDGRYLASSYSDLTIVKIWNVEDNLILQNMAGHTNAVTCISYSTDGKYFASGSFDNTVKIWDVKYGNLLQTLKGHNSIVSCVSYSPDSKYLASSSWDNTIKIWGANGGNLLQTLSGCTARVTCISYSPDGRYLSSGSSDHSVIIWDVGNCCLFKYLKNHSRAITCISYSYDGKYLASGSFDHTVKIWDTNSGNLLKDLKKHTDDIMSISFSPDGKYLASCSTDRTVKIWGIWNGWLIKNLDGYYSSPQRIVYSLNGKYLALSSFERPVKIWNAQNNSLLQTLREKNSIINYISHIWDYIVKILNLEDNILTNIERITCSGRCMNFSSDSKYLALGSDDNTVKIWDIEDGWLLKNLIGHTACVSCISYSPNGKYLVTGSDDATVKTWELKNNHQLIKTICCLTKEMSLIESPLVVEDATIEKATISTKNQRIFDQKGANLVENISKDQDYKAHDSEVSISASIGYKKSYNKLLDNRFESIIRTLDSKLISLYFNSDLQKN